MDFSKFESMVDIDALRKDVATASENSGTYDEVPVGTYEVYVEKMELTESKSGNPMVSIWFKICGNEHKNQMLFMNQVIIRGFQIHVCNELLRSMDTGIDVQFESFQQYANLIFDIKEKLDAERLGFVLNYGKRKEFNTFEITDVFERAPF